MKEKSVSILRVRPAKLDCKYPIARYSYTGTYEKKNSKMLKGAIRDYFDYFFGKEAHENVEISITDTGKSDIGISCSNLSLLMSLILIKTKGKKWNIHQGSCALYGRIES